MVLGKGTFPYTDADFAWGQVLISHGKRYASGLFTNAPSSIEFILGKNYERFISDILVKDSTVCSSGADFSIFLDNNQIFSSGSILSSDPPQHLDLEVSGGNMLRLVTNTATDGTCDWTIWGNPYLTPKNLHKAIYTSTPMPLGDYLINLIPLSESVGYWTLGKGVFPAQDTGFLLGETLESHGITYIYGLFAHAPSELNIRTQ